MVNTVTFRDFEERDIDFIYKCKNDEKLNSMIVGDYHPYTYEEATKWVHGCMGEHETFKFWAVCTNDVEKRIIGWVSLSDINMIESSASFHGIVIADPRFRDGLAWIESYLFVYDYAFEKLNLNKVYGSALVNHVTSQTMRRVMYGKTIDYKKNAVFKNGIYHDISVGELSRDVYTKHKNNGDYKLSSILKRVRFIKKEIKETL
jgi:RimJ/RimL family protein N-acetyltransferase